MTAHRQRRAGRTGAGFEAQPEPHRLIDEQQRVVERLEHTVGASDPRTANAQVKLAALLRAAGDLLGAREVCATALARLRKVLGGEHPQALAAASELGLAMLVAGRLVEAERLLRFVHEKTLAQHGPDDRATASAAANLALVLRARGDIHGARAMQENAVSALRGALGHVDPATLRAETTSRRCWAPPANTRRRGAC